MKPYNWIPKYSNVFELKHDSTIGNKKEARQHANKEIASDVYHHYFGVEYVEQSDYWDKKISL